MNVLIYKNLGRYDLCSNRKEWQVVAGVDNEKISAFWPEDEEPDIDGLSAAEVVQLILDRVNRSWINTSGDRVRALADKWLTNCIEIDAAWAEQRIALLQRQSARLYSEIHRLRINYLEE